MKIKTIPFRGGLLAAAWCLSAGCVGTGFQSPEVNSTQERENQLVIEENFSRVSGRIESLELEIERMRKEIESLRAEQTRVSDSSRALQTDVEARIASLQAKSAQDKNEIIEQLTQKIASLIKSGSASTPSAPRTGPRKISETGVEHTVEAGQTLSEIARAYGKKIELIMDANNIKDPTKVRAGQKLFIPD